MISAVCFFLFVEFTPQSYCCVCFPVGLAGKQTKRKGKKKKAGAGNIWIFVCARHLGTVCIRSTNPMLFPEIHESGKYILKITILV